VYVLHVLEHSLNGFTIRKEDDRSFGPWMGLCNCMVLERWELLIPWGLYICIVGIGVVDTMGFVYMHCRCTVDRVNGTIYNNNCLSTYGRSIESMGRIQNINGEWSGTVGPAWSLQMYVHVQGATCNIQALKHKLMHWCRNTTGLGVSHSAKTSPVWGSLHAFWNYPFPPNLPESPGSRPLLYLYTSPVTFTSCKRPAAISPCWPGPAPPRPAPPLGAPGCPWMLHRPTSLDAIEYSHASRMREPSRDVALRREERQEKREWGAGVRDRTRLDAASGHQGRDTYTRARVRARRRGTSSRVAAAIRRNPHRAALSVSERPTVAFHRYAEVSCNPPLHLCVPRLPVFYTRSLFGVSPWNPKAPE
jgi:hypothetical protein